MAVAHKLTQEAATAHALKWMSLLGTSEQGGRDYTPRIEGEIPQELRGSLYRNGPGLFERGGHQIRHLLDGDGLIQRVSFSDAGVRYQNAFVQTKKYVAEQAAGRFLYGSWTTRKPGGFLKNIGGGVSHSQAGVTVYPVSGRIIARDETGPSYEVDAETLKTLAHFPVGNNLESVGFKAHSKFDAATGEWLLAGQEFGRTMKLHITVYESGFKLKAQYSFDSPRQVYIHDFFASQQHFIFVLHPCNFSPFSFLAGLRSFTDSLTWQGTQGNLIAVIPRSGGEAKFYEAPGAFMWHSLNAFETGDELIADFVGYDEPDHFIGEHALFYTLMEGRLGLASAPGKIRRYIINRTAGTLKEEIVDAGNHEFPMIDQRAAMERHRIGYFATGGLGGFNSGVKRLDYSTGASEVFDFGRETQVGEPIFARKPDGARDEGWLLTQCLDGASQQTFFAVFDAQTVSQGPVARVWLSHHVPISFHGSWRSAR